MTNQFIVGESRNKNLEGDQIYKDTKIIRLEQNYRSTQNILSVASKLISYNQNRVGKTLKLHLKKEN